MSPESPRAIGGGTGAGLDVARQLVRLERGRHTGSLRVRGPRGTLWLLLEDGRLAWIEHDPDAAGESGLGRFLVDTGRLDAHVLDLAAKLMQQTGQGLGQTLTELGHLSPEQLRAAEAEHALGVVGEVLQWRRCSWEADEPRPRGGEATLGLAPSVAVLGRLEVLDVPGLERVVGDPEAVLHRGDDPPGAGEDPPSPAAAAVLDLVWQRPDETLRPADVAEASGLGPSEVLRAIAALVVFGRVSLCPDPATVEAPPVPAEASGLRAEPAPPVLPQGVPAQVGRYLVRGELGRGAMGSVYLAEDPTIDRAVAIKLIQIAGALPPAERERFVARFYQEARAAGKLLHPGIVTVFDVAHTETGTPYLVMEYVEGETLEDRLARGPLLPEEAIRIGAEILDALAYAHSQGVVHRDVKPANVILAADGRAKIMDFGVAHLAGSKLTRAEDVVGTPSYLSPELLTGSAVDRRADLFSFGVLLYEALTGRLPFTGDSIFAVTHAIASRPHVPASAIRPDIPQVLSVVIDRCLRKNAEERFGTAEEVRTALLGSTAAAPGAEQEPGSVPPVPGPSARRRGPAAEPSRTQVASGSGLARLLAIGVPLVVVLGLGSWWALSARAPAGAASASHDVPAALPGAAREHPAAAGASSGGPTAPPEASAGEDPAVAAATTTPEPTPEGATASTASEPDRGAGLTAPQLLVRALTLRDAGQLEESRDLLLSLTSDQPDYPGAKALLDEVEGQLWRSSSLPIVRRARHNHRLGSCEGRLTLADWGMEFRSREHDPQSWRFKDILSLELEDSTTLRIETGDRDLLRIGGGKRYVFELSRPISAEDWRRYRALDR